MTPTRVHLSSEPWSRARASGLEIFQANGSDVESVLEAGRQALEQARRGNPAFVEVVTHRWGGHDVGDPALYRPKGEEQEWRQRFCPVQVPGQRLGWAPEEIAATQERLEAAAQLLVAEVLAHHHRVAS